MNRRFVGMLVLAAIGAAIGSGLKALYWHGFRQGQWYQHYQMQSAINDWQVQQFNERCRQFPNYGAKRKNDI